MDPAGVFATSFERDQALIRTRGQRIALGLLLVALIVLTTFTTVLALVGAWAAVQKRVAQYVAAFALLYLLWGLTWTMNDIPYWALLPALTLDQKQRERIGALAKIFATIGLFSVVVAIIPVSGALGGYTRAWLMFTAAVVTIMLASDW